MYSLIPLLLILASLIVIIIIVTKKFAFLANLDVDSIPGEKEARFKESIAGTRIKRTIIKWNSKAFQFSKGFFGKASNFLKIGYDKLFQLKDAYEKQIEAEEGIGEDSEKKIKRLLDKVNDLDIEEDFIDIENKLIEIVGLDSKNITAFEKLGDVYSRNKKFSEARETYEHILKLLKDDDIVKQAEVYYDLALVAKHDDNWKEVLDNIKQAFSLVSNNPRYLDIMFEASIINQDKESATTAYNKLAEVNPENKKLEDFKKQLEDLTKSS